MTNLRRNHARSTTPEQGVDRWTPKRPSRPLPKAAWARDEVAGQAAKGSQDVGASAADSGRPRGGASKQSQSGSSAQRAKPSICGAEQSAVYVKNPPSPNPQSQIDSSWGLGEG